MRIEMFALTNMISDETSYSSPSSSPLILAETKPSPKLIIKRKSPLQQKKLESSSVNIVSYDHLYSIL
jgi:hypothetical protein